MDKRSKTSAINGAKGGRPKRLQEWDGGLPNETWKHIGKLLFESSLGRKMRVKKGAISLIINR